MSVEGFSRKRGATRVDYARQCAVSREGTGHDHAVYDGGDTLSGRRHDAEAALRGKHSHL